MRATVQTVAQARRKRMLRIALGASLIPLLMAIAPRLDARPSGGVQDVEGGAPQQTVPPPETEHAADAVDHARDGLPPPQVGDEDPMTSQKPPPTQLPPTQTQGMATPPPPAKPLMWTQLDANVDGRISASEARANADFSTRFASIDTDRDGFVDETEYRSHDKSMDESEEKP